MSIIAHIETPYTPQQARQFAPLQLAYIGDAVYDLYVRTFVISRHDAPGGVLHKRSVAHVNAAAQADGLERVLPELCDEEKEIVRRARNAHTPKRRNTTSAVYGQATALEALIGYLYLTADDERIRELMTRILSPKGEVSDDIQA